MTKSVLWIAAAFCLALSVGPVALLASTVGKADPADLYLVIDAGLVPLPVGQMAALGARDIGPTRGAMARMLYAPPAARQKMLDAGYILLPAGALAALCGIGTDRISATSGKT
ncbi:MAG: hypothetical protein AAFZ99_03975 [Pseudomonadota bacterium]